MKTVATDIADVKLIAPDVFSDDRGFFFESYNGKSWAEAGITGPFVQDNHSRSTRGVLRGLHYQVEQPQGKLVRVAVGEIFDVAVDLRRDSATFGKWVGATLSAENHLQLWVPVGFAHGFLVLSEEAEVLYKTTDYYCRAGERCLIWNDPAVGIQWPQRGAPLLSDKDKEGRTLAQADCF